MKFYSDKPQQYVLGFYGDVEVKLPPVAVKSKVKGARRVVREAMAREQALALVAKSKAVTNGEAWREMEQAMADLARLKELQEEMASEAQALESVGIA